jgi:hypothetical protein
MEWPIIKGYEVNISSTVSDSVVGSIRASFSYQGTDWRSLYWGPNVARLMSIKNFWDSGDMFRHCQSLTSNNASCCPT